MGNGLRAKLRSAAWGHPGFGYACALVSVVAVFVLRLALQPLLGNNGPLLFFQAPVILSALFFGIGPGLLAACLGVCLATYAFILPAQSLVITDVKDFLRVLAFAGEGLLISVLGGLYRSKKEKLAEALRAVSKAFYERERATASAHQLQLELAHVWRLNTMGEMAASLAHQLGHPIASIINYSQALLRLPLPAGADDEAVDAIEEIAKEAQRAADFVNNLRAFMKQSRPNLEEHSLNSIVQEIAAMMEHELSKHHVHLELKLTVQDCRIVADRIQIEQVTLNLLRNAVESIVSRGEAEGREVCVMTMLYDDEFAQVQISDTGCGIASDHQTKVGEPFFTTKAKGMGMGLAISRSLLEANSGRLWFTSEEQRGSTFSFTLPLAKVGGPPHE